MNHNNLCALLLCTVDGVHTTALLDTGADVCLMSFDVYKKLPNKPLLTKKCKLSGIYESMDLYGWMIEDVPISFSGQSSMKWKMLVATIKDPIIIGIDCFHYHLSLNAWINSLETSIFNAG